MKKKIVAVTLAAAMAISMAGCAGNGPAKATSAETAAGTGAGEKADPASENKEAEGTGSPKEEGGTAARHSAACVDKPLLQPVQQPGPRHGSGKEIQLLPGDQSVGVVEHHPGSYSTGGVGHNADDGVVSAGHSGDPLHS